MKSFDYFIQSGDVRRVAKDPSLSASLIKTAQQRLAFAAKHEITDENAKFILECAYEALGECMDARLALDGYKSYSHEACISYLQKFSQFSAYEINKLDRLRAARIGSKYYGRNVQPELAKDALKFAVDVMPKIMKLVK
jgi:hypothetical protein